MKLNTLQSAFIYFLLFLGLSSIIDVAITLLLAPLMPSLLDVLSSPNFTFSPAAVTPFILNIVGLVIAIAAASRLTNKLIFIAKKLPVVCLALVFYMATALLPMASFFLSPEFQQHMQSSFLSSYSTTFIFMGVSFILFFLLSLIFLKEEASKHN